MKGKERKGRGWICVSRGGGRVDGIIRKKRQGFSMMTGAPYCDRRGWWWHFRNSLTWNGRSC